MQSYFKLNILIIQLIFTFLKPRGFVIVLISKDCPNGYN